MGLPELLAEADRLERGEATDADIRALLLAGSSLGGARPKAHVRGADGRVAIAKFPSPSNDEWDVMRWEAVSLQLARDAGIEVPGFHLHVIDGTSVLFLDRFDRSGSRRVGYVSAMTMLEATDGESASYLDIAEAIEVSSPRATADLRELWRRIAFSILISNTDDHLRNHGFIRATAGGWSLSPAFDLNPDPAPGVKHLRTAIDETDTTARVSTLMDVAGLFRLDGPSSRHVLREVSDATSGWRRAANRAGLNRADIERMRPAFEHDEADAARAFGG